MKRTHYDYVIVGGGTAGCVLANRLSADGRFQVALIEAGPRDRNPWIHIPIGYAKTMFNPRYNWGFNTEPEPELNDRRIHWPRGRVLGGSSSINGLIYIRGQAADYDQWEALGNPGWGWRDVLPRFRELEANERGASEFHGAHGPLGCSDIHERPELMEAIIRAGNELGVPSSDDFNGAAQEGVGYYQLLTRRGRRSSTAVSYLRPARSRANLDILTDTRAARIAFAGDTAVAVECQGPQGPFVLRAGREILLCAGSVQSPQLLELSGIGEPGLLRGLGIDVVHAAPGVGENLQDHLQVRLLYRCRKPVTTNDALNSMAGRLRIGLQYLLHRSGPMAVGINHLGLFTRVLPESSTPDVQFHIAALTADKVADKPHPWPGFTLSVCQLRPSSRGSIHIRSNDVRQAPAIRANYLSHPDDWRCTVAAVRFAQELANAKALADYTDMPYQPARAMRDDDEIVAFCREHATTIFHPVGTCRMGSDDDAVVDPDLRVRGVRGLRVVDASVMPVLVSGNTSAPSTMIAEKIAARILAA